MAGGQYGKCYSSFRLTADSVQSRVSRADKSLLHPPPYSSVSAISLHAECREFCIVWTASDGMHNVKFC